MANFTLIVPAKAFYKDSHFVNLEDVSINVDRIQGFSPRAVWVKRFLVPGEQQVQTLMTFEPSSAEAADANTLQGVYLEVDGEGMCIDCINVNDFDQTANGNQATLTRRYASGITAFTSPTPTVYCIARLDDGSGSAHNKFVMDYVSQYIGNVQHQGHTTGTSIYKISSYTTPVLLSGDVTTTCP